jgi:hypothetical protein
VSMPPSTDQSLNFIVSETIRLKLAPGA